MLQKIFIGIFSGAIVGMVITSMFINEPKNISALFLTKITATSMVTGLICSIISWKIKSKLNTFFTCTLAGPVVFYIKYLITGHDFDPITMGLFVGAILGGVFVLHTKNYCFYKKIQTLKKTS